MMMMWRWWNGLFKFSQSQWQTCFPHIVQNNHSGRPLLSTCSRAFLKTRRLVRRADIRSTEKDHIVIFDQKIRVKEQFCSVNENVKFQGSFYKVCKDCQRFFTSSLTKRKYMQHLMSLVSHFEASHDAIVFFV